MYKMMKVYLALVLVLISAQFVIAGERVVEFQRELDRFHKEREPSQMEVKEQKLEFKNPAIEVKVEDKEEQEKEG